LRERYSESVRSVSLLSNEFALQSQRLSRLEKQLQVGKRRN
jgi:hypothetical protein